MRERPLGILFLFLVGQDSSHPSKPLGGVLKAVQARVPSSRPELPFADSDSGCFHTF